MKSTAEDEPGRATRQPPSGPDVASHTGLFVRRSTGLVRDIGLANAFGVNAGAQSIGGAFAFFGLLLLLFPGVNILLMLLVGGLLIAPLAWVYSQLAVAMPRSGGDYVFASRVFGPVAGVSAGTMHLFIWWSGLAALGSFWARAFLPFTFTTLATVFHASFLTTLATDVATRNGTFIATTIILALAALVTLGGTRLAARVAFWSVVAGVISIVLIVVELLVHSVGDVQRAFDHTSGAIGTDAHVIGQAKAHGWHGGHTVSGTLSALPYAFLIFAGYWSTAFVAGEVRRPLRTQLLSTLVTIAISVLALAVAWIALERAGGGRFIEAAYFLAAHAPAAYAKLTPIGLSPQGLAVLLADPVSKVIIAVGFLGWLLPVPIVFLMGMSRVLFAMSFDRVLPATVASVTSRRHTPAAALLANVAISEAFLALIVFQQGFAQAFRNANLLALVLSTIACLAVVVLPFRRRDLFAASPQLIRGTWLGVPPIVIVAGIGAAFCGTGVYLALTKGQYSGGYTTVSVISLAVMLLAGPALYMGSRYVRGRQGVDVALAMRTLPPE
jgi:basic amino acid/polyamine antiporter, APA family